MTISCARSGNPVTKTKPSVSKPMRTNGFMTEVFTGFHAGTQGATQQATLGVNRAPLFA
jgi:hypothetical protein